MPRCQQRYVIVLPAVAFFVPAEALGPSGQACGSKVCSGLHVYFAGTTYSGCWEYSLLGSEEHVTSHRNEHDVSRTVA
eukprot:3650570-Alexandrium_andersonii.AAC.1